MGASTEELMEMLLHALQKAKTGDPGLGKLDDFPDDMIKMTDEKINTLAHHLTQTYFGKNAAAFILLAMERIDARDLDAATFWLRLTRAVLKYEQTEPDDEDAVH